MFSDCFIAGTLVLTESGLVKIEDIKPGDKVYAYDEKTNKKQLKEVKQVFRNKTKEWLHLVVQNTKTNEKQEIVCTPNHRIFVKNKGWIKASQIIENDKTLLYNNDEAKVISKTIQKLDEYETIYNFEVEELHNYYVGNLNVLVHNDCVTTPDGEPVYRGGNKFKLRDKDYKLDGDGFVTTRRGPSVNTSIKEAASHGKPHKLMKMPDGLGLKKDGNDPGHYIIVPTRKMHLDEFQQLLNEIVLERVV